MAAKSWTTRRPSYQMRWDANQKNARGNHNGDPGAQAG
jgi:hypothetical protein